MLTSFQLGFEFTNGESSIFNFSHDTTAEEAYTQYAAFVAQADKSGKAKRIQLKDLMTAKVVEETRY